MAGIAHNCSVLSDGSAKCWGSDGSGQLGDGSTAVSEPPVAVGIANVTSMAAGEYHTCAALTNGRVTCWGDNTYGQLGDGTHSSHLTPGTLVAGLSNVVAIASGFTHTCALDAGGVVRCWGTNGSGELGTGNTSPSSVPSTVAGLAGSIGALGISAGGHFNCGRRGNGTESCWGEGGDGQLGNGSIANSPNAVRVGSASFANVVGIAAGGSHSCALQATGAMSCWGSNSAGQIGTASSLPTHPTPAAVAGLSENVIQVAAGATHSCALLGDGTVRCWGKNSSGQLGDGDFLDFDKERRVIGLTDVVAVSSGTSHTCALLADHTVRCWGDNSRGELGDGSAESNSATPVTVLGLDNAVAVSAGHFYTCALSATGTVRCWGSNSFGQLGNGTKQDRSVPDTVTGVGDAIAIAAGGAQTCAVRAEGSALCWGSNRDRQLGTGDSADHLTPAPVIGSFVKLNGFVIGLKLANLIAVAPNRDPQVAYSCALLANGQPRCWGSNSEGQLGDGTMFDRQIPTIVNSFTANVDPSVSLRSNARIAIVTALLNCPVGGHAQIYLTLRQGPITGDGAAAVRCEGGLIEVPLTVPAHGPTGYQAGPATALVEVIVKDQGAIEEDQHWTRDVTIF